MTEPHIDGHYLNHPGVLMQPEMQYHHLLAELLELGDHRMERTRTGANAVFGRHMRFDLSHGFPLLTTKFVPLRLIALELLWFLRGDTNAKWLEDQGVNIWREWGDPVTREMGPIYGKQWRSWAAPNGVVIDQIAKLIAGLRANPFGRRHIVSAWNPADIDDMALPPCHCLFQFFVSSDRKLSCQLYQRSADAFLGLPFNIASYALLTRMLCVILDLEPGEFIWTGGDVHLYDNHRDQAELQLSRRVMTPFPNLTILLRNRVDDFTLDDFILRNYAPQPHIPAPVAK